VNSTYGFGVSCPRCGGRVEHVSSTLACDPMWTSGVARCCECSTELFIRVTLEVLPKFDSVRARRYRKQPA
jgi:hypothetical protein